MFREALERIKTVGGKSSPCYLTHGETCPYAELQHQAVLWGHIEAAVEQAELCEECIRAALRLKMRKVLVNEPGSASERLALALALDVLESLVVNCLIDSGESPCYSLPQGSPNHPFIPVVRNHCRVLARHCARPTAGSQLSFCLARLMSGRRLVGSSAGRLW